MNFQALTNYLDRLPEKGVPGCDLLIFKDHREIYRHFSGCSEPGKPMNGKETYWLYSATKVYTMTAVMQLIERGIIGLDDPVSKYIPAYADLKVKDGDTVRPAKTVLTIRHLMSMQGGLNYELDTPVIHDAIKQHGDGITTLQLIECLAQQPLDFEPGTHFQYSLCHDAAAALVEAVSGMRFGEYLQKNIFEPLGIRSLGFKLTDDLRSRLAARYRWDENSRPVEEYRYDNIYVLYENYESGGAGLIGDVESYILLADALANGGTGCTGAQILQPETIDLMRTDQLSGASRADFDTWERMGYSYALGVRTMVDTRYSHGPKGEFGWDSAGGAWVLIDPENHLSAFYAQHILNCGDAYHVFHPAIRDLIYDGLKET